MGVNRTDAYTLALAQARQAIRRGVPNGQAVREACDRYRSSISTAAEVRMIRQLKREETQ